MEPADNGDSPDPNKDERSLFAESVRPLQTLIAKSTAVCRSRSSAILDGMTFLHPEEAWRNVDPGD